jgi:hypothetical protein
MTEKRKVNPLFPTLIMGAGGRPTCFKMAKNVKSLIIFAHDFLRWSCLGVSCPKFEILPNSSDQVDMKLTYFNHINLRCINAGSNFVRSGKIEKIFKN